MTKFKKKNDIRKIKRKHILIIQMSKKSPIFCFNTHAHADEWDFDHVVGTILSVSNHYLFSVYCYNVLVFLE